MRSSIQSVSQVVMLASLGSVLMASLSLNANAQGHQYSSQLVQRYNSGCSDQLQKQGYSDVQAQSLCACSLQQMQQQHSQSSAIVILTSAQLNPAKDPKLGLPTNLSKYFTPCFG